MTVTGRLVRTLALAQAGQVILPDDLLTVIINVLEAIADPSISERQRIGLADRLFETLNVEFIPPNPSLGAAYWSAMMRHVWHWEDSNRLVHKGSAYYFLGTNFLRLGDIPSAYISLFSALEEDKRSYPSLGADYRNSPVYKTTSLIDDSGNVLFPSVVVPLRNDLQGYLVSYLALGGSSISMNTIDSKFLQESRLEDVKRFFVATLHEIHHLAPINSTRMMLNDYSKTKVIDTLFNLGLVINQTLEQAYLASMSRLDMANAVHQLWLARRWTTERNVGTFIHGFSPDPNSGTPDQILRPYLDGTALFNGSRMDAKMLAIPIAYILRNYGGHHLEVSNILVNRYPDVLRNMMHAFLLAIDSLP